MIKEEKLTGEIANRIYNKAYANGLQKGREEFEIIREEMLIGLNNSINSLASMCVYICSLEGINIDSERIINNSSSDSPVGRLKELIAKIENIARN